LHSADAAELAQALAQEAAAGLSSFNLYWSPKAMRTLSVFVKLNPAWPVPLLCLVVGHLCVDHFDRSPALVVSQSLVLATLKATAVAAGSAAAPRSSAIVTLSRAFENLIHDDGVPRLLSLSKICRVWFDDVDLPALRHLANSALRKLIESCRDRMGGRTVECWLPAMTENGVFLRQSFFLAVMLPVAKAMYALPCDSSSEHQTLCDLVRSPMWRAAVHGVVFAFFEESVRALIESSCPVVAGDVQVAVKRSRLREDMEREIETFISNGLVMRFVHILLRVRLTKLQV
jgi:hypothetical protein